MGAAWPGVVIERRGFTHTPTHTIRQLQATTKTGQSKSTARAGLVQVGSSSPDGGEAASASQVLPPPQPSAEHIPASHGSSAPSSSSTPRPVRKLNDQPPVSKNLSAEQQRAIALASDELARARGSKFHTTYTTLKVVGHGAFAKVHICQHNKTQELFAAKIIARSADDESKQRDGIIREIAIMRMLAEHPNTIKLVEVFEDSDAYYLVMELCKGGELFDQIIAKVRILGGPPGAQAGEACWGTGYWQRRLRRVSLGLAAHRKWASRCTGGRGRCRVRRWFCRRPYARRRRQRAPPPLLQLLLVPHMCGGAFLLPTPNVEQGHFTEKEAAGFLRCLFDFIAYAHERNIMHRCGTHTRINTHPKDGPRAPR